MTLAFTSSAMEYSNEDLVNKLTRANYSNYTVSKRFGRVGVIVETYDDAHSLHECYDESKYKDDKFIRERMTKFVEKIYNNHGVEVILVNSINIYISSNI